MHSPPLLTFGIELSKIEVQDIQTKVDLSDEINVEMGQKILAVLFQNQLCTIMSCNFVVAWP